MYARASSARFYVGSWVQPRRRIATTDVAEAPLAGRHGAPRTLAHRTPQGRFCLAKGCSHHRGYPVNMLTPDPSHVHAPLSSHVVDRFWLDPHSSCEQAK